MKRSQDKNWVLMNKKEIKLVIFSIIAARHCAET
jgi:hypothetical protein